MDGLYAVLDPTAKKVRVCSFAYDLAAGRREVRRLRRIDPPPDDIVPIEVLPSIAPDDEIVATHFLTRAVFAMMVEQNHRAVRYLRAFSALAMVRFAYITVVPEQTGLAFDLQVIDSADYHSVHQLFLNPLDQ